MSGTIEDVIDARVRVAVKEELRIALREVIAEVKPAEDGAECLTIAKASRYADVHEDTMRGWIKEGRLQCERAGRGLRVRRRELDRFLTSGPIAVKEDGPGIEDLVTRARERRNKR